MNPYLSVIIPAYNETENIKANVLDEVDQYLKKRTYDWEVILVDDGSTDQTAPLLKQFIKGKKNWRLIENPHQGKAPTVKTGVLKAQGKYILFTDFDQATPLSEIEKLLPFMKKDYQVAIGSREVKGSKRENEPWIRHLMGKVFNLVVQFFTIRGVHDTQCGFKLFTHQAAKDLFSSLVVYAPKQERTAFTGAFDVELLYLAQKRKLKIAEVPIHWKHVHTERINPLRDSIRMFLDVIKIRWADLTGSYIQNATK